MPCSSSAYAIPTGITLDPVYTRMLPAHSSHVYCYLILIFTKYLELNLACLTIQVQQKIWNLWWLWASMSWDYSRSSQISYCKCEEEQHKTDENLLNLKVFQGAQLILQVSSVERLALWREVLQSHQLSLGEVISCCKVELFCPRMAGHRQSTEPDLGCTLTNPPSISWLGMPKTLCHMEGTRVSVQSIVFCYDCTRQKIVGAKQLKRAYKKLMADINTNLQKKNGQKGRWDLWLITGFVTGSHLKYWF